MHYTMRSEDHRVKGERLRRTLAKLQSGDDYEVVIETCYAAAVQFLAVLSQGRLGRHHDTHKGLARFLDDAGLPEAATRFRDLEALRASRFYGAQGNGQAAKFAREVLDAILAAIH